MIIKSFSNFIKTKHNLIVSESMSEEEIINIIQNREKIYVEYINGYPNHDINMGYQPIDIDPMGDITLDIDGNIYTTKLKWVIGINEISHYEVEPHMVMPRQDPATKTTGFWRDDKEFLNLLRDHGGMSGLKKKMKKKFNIDYSKIKSIDKLYQELKSDNMI